jgi:hypothetical protein
VSTSKGRIYEGSTPSRILDILETDGMWMTAEQLEAEFKDRFGVDALGNIRRSIYRLINNKKVEHRLVLFIDYNATPTSDNRGAQSTPSGRRAKQLVEVRTL